MGEGQDREKIGRIIRAALAVFSRRGFHKATMQDIATEAGIAKGTTYLYFTSKEQLLEHIADFALQEYVAQVERVALLPLKADQKLRLLVENVLGLVQANRDHARFLVEGTTGLSEELKLRLIHIKREALERIAEIIRQGVSRRELRDVPVVVAAHMVVGTINSTVAALLWDPESLPGDGGEPEVRTKMLVDQLIAVFSLEAGDRLALEGDAGV